MNDDVRFALLAGRLIDLLRSNPRAVEDQKASLRGLAALVERRSLTLRLSSGGLYVEGTPIPPDTPFVGLVVQQLGAHGLAAVSISRGAPAVDMLHLTRAIALDPRNYPVGSDATQRLKDAEVVSVSLVTSAGEQAAHRRRAMRVTDAIEQSTLFASEGVVHDVPAPPVSDVRGGTTIDDIAARPAPAAPPLSSTLAGTVSQLSHDDAGPRLAGELDGIQRRIEREMSSGNVLPALEAIIALIRREEEPMPADAKRAYGVMVRRCLTMETLRRVVPYLLDELYTSDVLYVLRRAGAEGTQMMIQQLVSAPTFAERKAYMTALRTIQEGTEVITGMLTHPEWYVIRNGADLVGEMRLVEAVPLLGRVAEHEDERVRLSVALALARIGTPEAVRYLRAPLRDLDRNVRLALAREIRGRGLGALAMVLLNAAASEEDVEVQAEYYRALGRIGTPEAVQALSEVAQSGKGFLARKGLSKRVAAVEGLGMAGGEVARAALLELAKDRDKDVRNAARAALDAAPA